MTNQKKAGFIARGGQIIDATLVPAPKQHFTKDDKEQLKQNAIPANWSPAKRRQNDLDATWTKKHGKSHHGYKLSICVDAVVDVITTTPNEHICHDPPYCK